MVGLMYLIQQQVSWMTPTFWSYKTSLNSLATVWLQLQFRYIKWMSLWLHICSLLLDIILFMQVYQQTDAYNCGIHALHNAAILSMVNKDNIRFS
jgi:hypothetical protein